MTWQRRPNNLRAYLRYRRPASTCTTGLPLRIVFFFHMRCHRGKDGGRNVWKRGSVEGRGEERRRGDVFVCRKRLSSQRWRAGSYTYDVYVNVDVYMYVYVCIFIYVYVYVCICVCMCMCICICIYVCICKCKCICICVCICICMCMCMCVRMCMYRCTCR